MKIIKKRITALFLTAAMTISAMSSLTGCGAKADIWQLSQEEAENVIELDTSITEGEAGARTITAAYSEELFKTEIASGDFYVIPRTDDETAQSDEEVSQATLEKKALKNVSAAVTDAKTLELSFTDSAENTVGYSVYISKAATTVNNSAFGSVAVQSGETVQASPTAAIAETFTSADENPTITLKLTDTSAAAELTTDMVSLGGAFSGLTVTHISGAQTDTVTLQTSGKTGEGFVGYVTLSDTASTANAELMAAADVTYISAYIDAASYKYDGGELAFDVKLAADTFAPDAAGTADFAIKSVSDDRTGAVLAVAVQADSVDGAIEAMDGKQLVIPAKALTSGKETTLAFPTGEAMLGAVVDYVENSGSGHTGTVYLFATNGTLDTLSADDLTFGGDFESAKNLTVEKQSDGGFKLTFSFDSETEEYDLSGTVSVADGKLKNPWGTNAALSQTSISFISVSDRDNEFDVAVTAVRTFLTDNKSIFKTISSIGDGVSGVFAVANGVKAILELTGVIDSTEAKIGRIIESVKNIDTKVDIINQSINILSGKMDSSFLNVDEKLNKNIYATNQIAWNTFKGKVADLDSMQLAYENAFYSYIKTYIDSSDTMEIPVYRLSDGTVTMLSPTSSDRDISYQPIKDFDKFIVNIKGMSAETMLTNNYGKMTIDIYNEVLANAAASCTANDIPVSGENIKSAIELAAASYAISQINASDFIVKFIAICDSIVGEAGNTSVLNSYYDMLSCFYNFESETLDSKTAMLAWLSGVVIEGASLATLANCCSTIDSSDKITAAVSKATDALNTNLGVHAAVTSKDWSYVANNYISVCEYIGGSLDGNRAMDQNRVKSMMNRYKRLYEAGMTSYSSFADYLKAHIGTWDFRGNPVQPSYTSSDYIVSSKYNAEFSLGESIRCDYVLSGSWFDVGQWYTYKGDANKGKRTNASCWEPCTGTKGEAIRCDGGATMTTFSHDSKYYESHWYWTHDEIVYFHDYLVPDKSIVIYIG